MIRSSLFPIGLFLLVAHILASAAGDSLHWLLPTSAHQGCHSHESCPFHVGICRGTRLDRSMAEKLSVGHAEATPRLASMATRHDADKCSICRHLGIAVVLPIPCEPSRVEPLSLFLVCVEPTAPPCSVRCSFFIRGPPIATSVV